jgi:hypothetical protein
LVIVIHSYTVILELGPEPVFSPRVPFKDYIEYVPFSGDYRFFILGGARACFSIYSGGHNTVFLPEESTLSNFTIDLLYSKPVIDPGKEEKRKDVLE